MPDVQPIPTDDDVAALEVRLFLEAIYARYGYDLRDYALPSMSRRVQVALSRSGLHDLGALQHRVLTDADAFARVLGDLTVQVSALFRDPGFYRTFRERVVPVLRTYPRLAVWHAGCASGEEAYSTAIVLREEGLAERCQSYATDLSAAAVERAKEGVYSAKDLDAVVDSYIRAGGTASFDRYATVAYSQIALTESLRSKILFFQHDLVADYVFAEMQVVFCRNVFIYFGRALRERVLQKLARSLCPGGFLCLGSSERLPTNLRGPFVEVDADARIYQLRGEP
ncbi:MAG TPA: protein-glutamate O-methyltransferase CheR [Polyangia bacterium]|jgi:chemotaxis protein methyltransferase CheR|nr:protein-glutamate O-methyltransferase CheR [Polyangia bacterium]